LFCKRERKSYIAKKHTEEQYIGEYGWIIGNVFLEYFSSRMLIEFRTMSLVIGLKRLIGGTERGFRLRKRVAETSSFISDWKDGVALNRCQLEPDYGRDYKEG